MFGAGATQAEATYLGVSQNLLMFDSDLGEGVSSGILKRMGSDGKPFLADRGVDIEKLISLLSTSGIGDHARLAEVMRRCYFDEICARIGFSSIIDRPRLAMALLEMHRVDTFKRETEHLSGIITTNHDGLLQNAFQEVFGEVSIGFPFSSVDLMQAATDRVPPILQLHGSFTWSLRVPLAVARLKKSSSYSPETVWVPPAVLKESKHYPFNKLVGLAHELLAGHCDLLRIVGASLTQNDWNVLSIIFNAQRQQRPSGVAPFHIELIMPRKACDNVLRDCSYLTNMTPIGSITDGEFGAFGDDPEQLDPDMKNVFFYWLKEKIAFHQRNGHFGKDSLGSTMTEIGGEPS